MTVKVKIWRNVREKNREEVRALAEGIGVLRSLVVGGMVFGLLSVPLLLNIQTTKYASRITSLTVETQAMQNEMIGKETQINSIMESYFPSARIVKISGQTFFVRKGK